MRAPKPLLLLLLLPAALASAEGGFAGTFENADLRLTLAPSGAGLEGTLTIRGRDHAVRGSEKAGAFEGVFAANGKEFPLTARWNGDTLLVESGRSAFQLKRVAPPAPPPGPNPLEEVTGPPPAPPPPPATPDQVLGLLRDPCPAEPDPKREWTILVYLDSDNNLEGSMLVDLNEMEIGLPAESVTMLVLVDRAKGFDASDGDWTDARLYRVRNDPDLGRIGSTLLKQLGEINMGDPAVLEAFVEGGFRAFPARQRALLMSDHGGGWNVLCCDDDAPGATGRDTHLDIVETREAVERGLKSAGAGRLGIFGFDMCLMAQLELACEIAPIAEVMVASQAIEPGHGWPFDKLLPEFGRGTFGARRLGGEIVQAFDAFYDAAGDATTTLSALDLSLLPETLRALDALLGRIRPELTRHWTAVSRALYFGESYRDRSDFRSGPEGLNSLDLLDVLRRVQSGMEPFPAAAEMQALVGAMDRFVIAAKNNEKYRKSTGAAVYAPVAASGVNPDYRKTRFASACGWFPFLEELHALQARFTTPPVFSNARVVDGEGKPIQSVRPLSGARYAFDVEGNNIVWTEFWEGARDAATGGMRVTSKGFVFDPGWFERLSQARESPTHSIDTVMPIYRDGRNSLQDDCLGLVLVATNGEARAEIMLDAVNPDDAVVWKAPALLDQASIAKQPLEATIFFDAIWWDVASIVAEVPQPGGKKTYMRIPIDLLEEGARLTFLHDVVRPDGTITREKGATLDWKKGLKLMGDYPTPGERGAYFLSRTMGDVAAGCPVWYRAEPDRELAEWMQSWKQYKPEWVEGTWAHYVLMEKEGKTFLQPTGMTFEARRNAKNDALFDVEVKMADGTTSTQLWIPDLASIPHFRFVDVEKGRLTSAQVGISFIGEKEGKLRILSKLLGLYQMWVFEKTGGGPANVVEDESRLQPVEVPDPEPIR